MAIALDVHPLAHHLSDEAQRRKPSLAKSLYAYLLIDDMQSLGGGLPDPKLFPIRHISYDLKSPADQSKSTHLDLWDKNAPNGEQSTIDLDMASQYAAGSAYQELLAVVSQLTKEIHQPPLEGQHVVAGTLGNTDGVAKAFRLFLNPGDNILFDEFVFGPPVENARAMGIGLVPVKLDSQGACPDALDAILSNWNAAAAGRRPRVFYTVTTGQNPTGTTPSRQRMKDLYQIAQKHDLIIIEDDPYFFLQLGSYKSRDSSQLSRRASYQIEETHTAKGPLKGNGPLSLEQFRSSLSPSLLSFDTDGRVVRCETFSKIIFPNARLGWIIFNPLFQERYERISEVTTQMGNGINQAFFAQLFTPPSQTCRNTGGWGMEGFLQWVNKVRWSYALKRDFFLDILNRELPAKLGLISCVAPEAGMFCWIEVHLEKHPRFTRNEATRPQTNIALLMEELFEELIASKCLILPASYFSVAHTLPAGFKGNGEYVFDDIRDQSNFFRATFAGNEATIEEALKRFGQTLKRFFA